MKKTDLNEQDIEKAIELFNHEENIDRIIELYNDNDTSNFTFIEFLDMLSICQECGSIELNEQMFYYDWDLTQEEEKICEDCHNDMDYSDDDYFEDLDNFYFEDEEE